MRDTKLLLLLLCTHYHLQCSYVAFNTTKCHEITELSYEQTTRSYMPLQKYLEQSIQCTTKAHTNYPTFVDISLFPHKQPFHRIKENAKSCIHAYLQSLASCEIYQYLNLMDG